VIVVDASVLAAFILKEPGWRGLAGYIKRCTSVDHVLKEVSNAIWRACIVKGYIDLSSARELLEVLMSLVERNMVLEPEERYLSEALEVALEDKITVYDALYIAMARARNLPLLTLDKGQARVARSYGVEVVVVD